MNRRLKEIEKEQERLEAEKKKILALQEEVELKKNWRELCRQVKACNVEEMIAVELTETTKTIPVFDNFVKSEKRFLRVKDSGRLYLKIGTKEGWIIDDSDRWVFKEIDDYRCARLSLIICKSWKRLYVHSSSLTPTKLKKKGCVDYTDEENIDFEFLPLWKEVNEAPFDELKKQLKHKRIVENKIVMFNTPVLMGAQTSKNREGYGNIYCGEELVRQGTEYGETTSFLIVGVVMTII